MSTITLNTSKRLVVSKRSIIMRKRDEIIKQIAELRERGYSFSEIARKLGLSKTTVWRYYKEWKERNRGPANVTLFSTINEVLSLGLIQSILENLKALERSLDDINRRLRIVEDKINIVYETSRLRIGGKLRCKHLSEDGYCTKILFDKCPASTECIEIILDNGIRAYRARVVTNPVICLVCPYYAPKKKF